MNQFHFPDDEDTTKPRSVSELTREIKRLLEASYPHVAVFGEVCNCRRPASGHVYFALKDSQAQLPAVMWRSSASRLRFDLQDGLEVVATGRVEVYAPQGKYQLIADRLEPLGVGELELAFRQLCEKLAAEGLFDSERKRPLPRFPNRIALITSPTGAAVRDLLQVITRRWKAADIVILPVAVQGKAAAPQIASALQSVAELPGVDVVVTGRGGGSPEDLWAFNEEVVARAIFDCPVPVISAVGHEIDVTIADLVADRRALTPSEAGEIVVPDRAEISAAVDHLRHRLLNGLTRRLDQARSRFDGLTSRPAFARPLDALLDRSALVDDVADQLQRALRTTISERKNRLATLSAKLDALSPFRVLHRGYSVTLQSDGSVLKSIRDIAPGDELHTRLIDGTVISRAESIDAERSVPHSGDGVPESPTNETR